MKVNIKIEKQIHSKAKAIAVLKDISLNDYFEKSIQSYVDKEKKQLEKLSQHQ